MFKRIIFLALIIAASICASPATDTYIAENKQAIISALQNDETIEQLPLDQRQKLVFLYLLETDIHHTLVQPKTRKHVAALSNATRECSDFFTRLVKRYESASIDGAEPKESIFSTQEQQALVQEYTRLDNALKKATERLNRELAKHSDFIVFYTLLQRSIHRSSEQQDARIAALAELLANNNANLKHFVSSGALSHVEIFSYVVKLIEQDKGALLNKLHEALHTFLYQAIENHYALTVLQSSHSEHPVRVFSKAPKTFLIAGQMMARLVNSVLVGLYLLVEQENDQDQLLKTIRSLSLQIQSFHDLFVAAQHVAEQQSLLIRREYCAA